jgi:hypothetical protein
VRTHDVLEAIAIRLREWSHHPVQASARNQRAARTGDTVVSSWGAAREACGGRAPSSTRRTGRSASDQGGVATRPRRASGSHRRSSQSRYSDRLGLTRVAATPAGSPVCGDDGNVPCSPDTCSSSGRSSAIRATIVKTAVLAGAALLLAGCGNTTSSTPTASKPTSASALDDAGRNACYLFFKWVEDATTLNPTEMHSHVKEIWDGGSGFTGTTGAKDTSNATIRDGSRQMLEGEVAGDTNMLSAGATSVGDECRRQAA